MTLFEKIITREIPAEILYEDDICIAIKDVNPQAPTHLLIIPKKPIAMLKDLNEDDTLLAGHLIITANKIAHQLALEDNYRIVINNGPNACQSVYHIHIHLLAGRGMSWPPG